jgi:DNA ligase D-like protein (predicted 3'-phosphoesterase)
VVSRNTLSEYREKRDFERSPEPAAAGNRKGEKPIFVVQKHAARNLHYDFRLQVGNVLKSWAVPKGPSTSPREKRLAVPTEDHPLAYADFEGVIPEGEYGAGTVSIWDKGTYRNLRKEKEKKSMAQSLQEGKVEIRLEGNRMKGDYALVRTGWRGGKKKNWLLIKMKGKKPPPSGRSRTEI